MFQEGDRVIVARANPDDCANEDYIGQAGTENVKHFETASAFNY